MYDVAIWFFFKRCLAVIVRCPTRNKSTGAPMVDVKREKKTWSDLEGNVSQEAPLKLRTVTPKLRLSMFNLHFEDIK